MTRLVASPGADLERVAHAPVRGRKLPHYLAVYVAACAGLLQLLDVAIERVGLPDRYFAVALIVCALGLPVAVGAAFVRELAHKDAVTGASRARSRAHLLGWTVAALVLLGGVVAVRTVSADHATDAAAVPGSTAILLAGFESRTAATGSDSALAAVVTDALRVDFRSDVGVELITERQLAYALALDGYDPLQPVTPALARRLATRVGAAAIVEGAVERAGSSYLVVARLVTPVGDELASVRQTAPSEDALWPAVDRASSAIRAAGRQIRPANAEPAVLPAPASPAALAQYASAVRAQRAGDTAAAQSSAAAALREDSTFVPALRLVGELAYARGDTATGRPLLARARELAEGITGRERYLTLAAYYEHVEQNRARASVSYRRWLGVEPGDSFARARLTQLRDTTAR